MTIGSLFSGIGGLELGLEMCGLGPVIWQAESDPYARAVLAKHWPTVHRYEDVRAIDGTTARVDVVCGGFPCQPHSLAGARRGTSDSRWLWPEFARIVETLTPYAVFIENVPGLKTSGLRDVLADLARLGFDAEWDLFTAAETGAPHRRQRLFIFAHANRLEQRNKPGRRCWTGGAVQTVAGDDGKTWSVADPNGDAWVKGWASNTEEVPSAREPARGGGVSDVANAARVGAGESADAADPIADCWPARSKLCRGSWWASEPDVGRVVNGVPSRAHRLKCLGNAVVPQQAALAWRTLTARVNQ